MKRYIFEGYSDDGFYEVGVTNESQDNCASGRPMTYAVVVDVENQERAGLEVTARREDGDGTWAISVRQVHDEKFVTWPVQFDLAGNGRLNRLYVWAPDESQLVEVER